MDLDRDGEITLEEFMAACLEDKKITQSIDALNLIQIV